MGASNASKANSNSKIIDMSSFFEAKQAINEMFSSFDEIQNLCAKTVFHELNGKKIASVYADEYRQILDELRAYALSDNGVVSLFLKSSNMMYEAPDVDALYERMHNIEQSSAELFSMSKELIPLANGKKILASDVQSYNSLVMKIKDLLKTPFNALGVATENVEDMLSYLPLAVDNTKTNSHPESPQVTDVQLPKAADIHRVVSFRKAELSAQNRMAHAMMALLALYADVGFDPIYCEIIKNLYTIIYQFNDRTSEDKLVALANINEKLKHAGESLSVLQKKQLFDKISAIARFVENQARNEQLNNNDLQQSLGGKSLSRVKPGSHLAIESQELERAA